MTTHCYKASEEESVTTELTHPSEASVVFQVRNALYHSKLAHNSKLSSVLVD